ncbi:MAG: cytochrome oxidase subunit III [Acidobacteria bacterium RIFCSPLOWO2_12_FULL_65_11]|nr:MAG: cytochrome oxidase subunit III [Acidobacteria bacterium RIFCSPLOWO2_02_FULL_64_15]OFW30434.1 MAG: cytochrome oxidase subunit III [Acidobacteria bacterium RIFCSPLOWO2_12_FULL_65_11]
MTQPAATTIDRWSGGTCPFDAGWRKVMMWWFIITDGLLFAGFLGAYGYARILALRWPDQSTVFSLPYIAAMTFVLITSSATMASAVEAAKEGKRRLALRFIVLTAIGGAVFLGMQAYEWWHLIEEGARLNTNPWGDASFSAYFFLLTGFHGSHVLTGVSILITTAIRTAKGWSTADGVEMAGLYWHFVDLVWVFIFTLFYLL